MSLDRYPPRSNKDCSFSLGAFILRRSLAPTNKEEVFSKFNFLQKKETEVISHTTRYTWLFVSAPISSQENKVGPSRVRLINQRLSLSLSQLSVSQLRVLIPFQQRQGQGVRSPSIQTSERNHRSLETWLVTLTIVKWKADGPTRAASSRPRYRRRDRPKDPLTDPE